jgi:hypothetical protein
MEKHERRYPVVAMSVRCFALVLGAFFLLTTGCTSTHCRVKEIEQLQAKQDPKPKTVHVYRYDGTLQCGMGKRIPIEEMQKELKDIPILSSAHLNDGLMRIQLCGSPTGDANVFQIEEVHLEKAKGLGFREWTFGGTSR